MAKNKPAIPWCSVCDEDLAIIRAQAELFGTIEKIDEEVRELIEDRWPDLMPERAVPNSD
jgi:hypothetical protein